MKPEGHAEEVLGYVKEKPVHSVPESAFRNAASARYCSQKSSVHITVGNHDA